MKWLFLVSLLALVPALAVWLRSHPRHAPKIWMILGFLPFVLDALHLYVAPISWAFWPGYVKGAELSVIDAFALAVLLSSKRVATPLPFKIVFGAYLLAILVSATQANVPQATLFAVWQMCRTYLLFLAVVRICQDDRGPTALIAGMTVGLALQAGIALSDRLSGAIQTGGSFGHQNLLGMTSYFVALPALALLLAGKKSWLLLLGPTAGIATAILGASRATIGFLMASLAILVSLSAFRRMTKTKGLVMMAGLLVMAVAIPLATASLERRFEVAPLSTYDERAAFEKAARMMMRDRPFGVGANNFVIVANSQGYWDRAGVAPTPGSRAAHVHNVYLLVGAEIGYPGLVALIGLLLVPVWIALRCAWKYRRDNRGDLMLGLAVALVSASAHSFYEWIFVTFQIQYIFAITLGLIAGLAPQLGYGRRAAKMGPGSRLLEVPRRRPVAGDDGATATDRPVARG